MKYDKSRNTIQRKSKGLGDSIEKLAKYTGLKQVMDKITGDEGCGCNARRATLNRKFPYKK